MSFVPGVYYRCPRTGAEFDYDGRSGVWVQRVYERRAPRDYAPQPHGHAPRDYAPRDGYAQDPDPHYYEDDGRGGYDDGYYEHDDHNEAAAGAAGALAAGAAGAAGAASAANAYEEEVLMRRRLLPPNRRLPPVGGDPYAVLDGADGRSGASDPAMLAGGGRRPPSEEERRRANRELMEDYRTTVGGGAPAGPAPDAPPYARVAVDAMKSERLSRLNAYLSESKKPTYDEAKAKEWEQLRRSTDPAPAPAKGLDAVDRTSMGVDPSRLKVARRATEERIAMACAAGKEDMDRRYRQNS